jgi:hypothetical protein
MEIHRNPFSVVTGIVLSGIIEFPPRRRNASIGVSQNSKAFAPPVPASNGNGQAVEASVRQLIANGKFRTALDNAKEFHKAQHTSASEGLLLDAYMARIQSLLDQNLALEAKSLLDLVRERFPSAAERLDALKAAASAHSGDLAGLLQPLNDPELNAERRAAIEQAVQTQVTDLTALAGCAAVPPEHTLRQAAAALDRAFNAVTSGPVTEDQIALPEVSHRSPLAPWKLLIRAIACLHRGEDEACREYLALIKPESVPSRLVPAMNEMLGVKPAKALKPAEAALVSRTSVNLSELRGALVNLDRAFANEDPDNYHGSLSANDSRIFKAVRVAVRECLRSLPDRLGELKRIIAVRGGVVRLDNERLIAALEGAPRPDAVFFRMYARALEGSGDPEELPEACELWEEFRQQAVREGWFRDNGVEAATLYLHMADLLGRMPEELLSEIQGSGGSNRKQAPGDARYFLFPDKLYARACAIDPHTEAFAQWMRWAAGQSVSEGESVAREWNRILRDDIDPLLYLMEQAEKRNAFPTALSYLEKAERIDAVHSVVRAARLRLLAAGAISHLQKKKPHLAAEKLAMMAALPQSQQGDRPAFLAALRHLICVNAGDTSRAEEARREVESLLGGVAAALLVFGIAVVSKRLGSAVPPYANALSRQERTTVPASVARVMAITSDFGVLKFPFPVSYLAETEAQFPAVSGSLDIKQIRQLGELGMATGHPKLAWAASGVGIERGGSSEAYFLLLRARAVPAGEAQRYVALTAAAAELGRFHRDMEVVDKAVEIVRNPFGGDSISLTLEQARDVVRKEIASPAFPGRFSSGPDYSDLMPRKLCQCPDCRRERGEISGLIGEEEDGDDYEFDGDDFDENDVERIFNESVPDDMPPETARMLLQVMKEALATGESLDEILSRVLGGSRGGGKRKKGRRRK